MFEQENTAVNDAYRNLMAAVVYQACSDYASVLRAAKKDKTIKPHCKPSYRFLINNPYCDILDIDGKALVKQMDENFKKYGKAMMSEKQWDMIAKFGKLVSDAEYEKALKKEEKEKKKKKKTFFDEVEEDISKG